MKLFIDGDAFPNLLKPIVLRAVNKNKLATFVISNKRINIGESIYITYSLVNSGPDEADSQIVEMTEEGDLVITSDIPLADRVITKKAFVVDHRGRFFDQENIKQALAIRNLMQDIRDSGIITKGQTQFNQKDAHEFANQLNLFLKKRL
ncbi:MAG: YaiI/YqxD family protein [Bacteroidetes bacterium]|nr:YaiI/YqxD family protein [Bacteroidota bacterium]